MSYNIEVTAGCGHTVDLDVPSDCHACDHAAEAGGELCHDHQHLIDEVKDDECGDCYRRNHPSLTAYERNM